MSSAASLPASGPRGTSALLSKLVDDAALFPPSNVAMPDALSAYLAERDGERSEVLGVFLCPASRLPELITELNKLKPSRPIPLSLVIDTGLGGVPKAVSIVEARPELLTLTMVEMFAPSDVDDVWLERVDEFVPEDAVRVIEPRRGGADWLDGVRRVSEAGYRPKLRCGGMSKENFPSVDEVADFLSVVSSSGTSFKATSGLPGAVRFTDDATGLTHHGFLNVMVATARTLTGRDARDALSSTDGGTLAEEASTLSEPAAKAVRAVFASYGSSTLGDPVADLQGLGLL